MAFRKATQVRRRAIHRRRLFGFAAAAMAGALCLTACGRGEASDARPSRTPDSVIDCARRGKVAGSGSTAQQNAMKHWMREYRRACPGVQIRYLPIGSGGGVAQFLRGATAFGGTDTPLSEEEFGHSRDTCPGSTAVDLPMVGGPIAIGYNIRGVDDLVLDASAIAKIFDSEITRWDDPEIRRLNPGVQLPATDITAVHRSDDSGTTQNLNAYLAEAAPEDWPYEKAKAWQAKGGHSAPGSDGIVSAMRTTDGSIGYFELSFAEGEGMSTVRLDTGAPEPVEVSAQSASAGIAAANVSGDGKDMTLEFDYRTKAPGAYPIVLVTYEVVCADGTPSDVLPALKSFLTYTASEEGQKGLARIHYAPLPDNVAVRVRQVVSELS
ncbi:MULTISPECIES: phosphate ABC transporter substrate-binding protein PstS [Streptomyces]|uniref:Phosphate-binding protein n=2 Tax=Streptomyces TaxID=1883 RepID=A0A3R7ILT8_9ACTN|nr:phosphate ABC transporter substrate-binding protein [Streptomyces fradiae]OFA49788.1 phosphate ABC transporter substrate-binding protein PstS [Streptomyces fradiae]PQM23457.1 phosphate ABC transporter substrate-binding protein PstS [Streptomyces xinghaiensis]RKM91564.1 phosphate ABC transporter substrate-binding protein PstS [Streptomyces xinghaiensis]RNC75024.1 phosphate ABC transporter substrate-binding protein PstS [Streptomyces xinghaiensis]